MISLDELSDEQNLLLTQLSYQSNVLENEEYYGKTLQEVLEDLSSKSKDGSLTEDELKAIGKAKTTLTKLTDSGLGSIRLSAADNDSVSGFGAVAFTDDYDNTGFSFRGTDGISLESINDWVDNATAAVAGTSVQSAQAEAFFDAHRDTNGNNYLYGHSKGGQLSESVYANNYNNVKEVHLLNPQPLNPYSLSLKQLSAMQSDKVDIVIVEGDYVWFLGALPSYGNIRIAKSNGGNSHLFSAIEDMFDDTGNIQPGSQPPIEYIAYFGISTILSSLQFLGGEIGYVYNCAVQVIDFVKTDLIPKAQEFIIAAANAIEEFCSDVTEFAHNLKSFLGAVVDCAKKWFKKDKPKPGASYAAAHPQIVVDTYKLDTYADRLKNVNSRLIQLDGRIHSLYGKVGLLDLFNLMQANYIIGYSSELGHCKKYLSETAAEFNAVENDLLGIM